MGTAIKYPVPDRVKPSFVIFDIRALWRSGLYPYGNSGRQRVKLQSSCIWLQAACKLPVCLTEHSPRVHWRLPVGLTTAVVGRSCDARQLSSAYTHSVSRFVHGWLRPRQRPHWPDNRVRLKKAIAPDFHGRSLTLRSAGVLTR